MYKILFNFKFVGSMSFIVIAQIFRNHNVDPKNRTLGN